MELAEVVDCFQALLSQDPTTEQYAVAESFVLGLGAAAQMQVIISDQHALAVCCILCIHVDCQFLAVCITFSPACT